MRRSDAAARVIQLADEMIALVKSWPERWKVFGAVSSNPAPGKPSLREIDQERLAAFSSLDAKISAASSLAGIPILPRRFAVPDHHYVVGHTGLVVFDRWACWIDEWESRILSLKQSAQEIVDIENPANAGGSKSAGEAWVEMNGPDLPPETKARLQAFAKEMANYPIEQFTPEALIRRIRGASALPSQHQLKEQSQGAGASAEKLFPKGLPRNRDIVELVLMINTEKGTGQSINEIARSYTGEKKGSAKKARSLLAQIVRMKREGRVKY